LTFAGRSARMQRRSIFAQCPPFLRLRLGILCRLLTFLGAGWRNFLLFFFVLLLFLVFGLLIFVLLIFVLLFLVFVLIGFFLTLQDSYFLRSHQVVDATQ
jgi:hypothetical protein